MLEDDPEMQSARDRALERGKVLAAEILSGSCMLTGEEMAARLGITAGELNAARAGGEVLGLDGAGIGWRYPDWQIGGNHQPYPGLSDLHAGLCGSWAVYRFLVGEQPELDGVTGLEAMRAGRFPEIRAAAESHGRDFS
ncbi:hypothetical protein ACEUZ9_002791 [Paracoccus litorisediminis]|uniref:hypothetical protein n=1 Tax=Paracoccus litorisediminis TaxID=2006130 RepID=UPI00372E56AB